MRQKAGSGGIEYSLIAVVAAIFVMMLMVGACATKPTPNPMLDSSNQATEEAILERLAKEKAAADTAMADARNRIIWAVNNNIKADYPVEHMKSLSAMAAAEISYDNERYVPAKKLAEEVSKVLSDQFQETVLLNRTAQSNAVLYCMAAPAGAMLLPSAAPVMPSSVYYQTGTNQNFNTEEYNRIEDNPYKNPLIDPVSTFSIDVDTASYANVRSYLVQRSELPPKDAVRIEELINYFSYDYPKPAGEHPVAAQVAMTTAPWNPAHYLLRVAVKAKTIEAAAAPPSNLVFLIDTSGSMYGEDRLGLIKKGLGMMVKQLREQDRVSIVVYAGNAGVVLEGVSGSDKKRIMSAIEKLEAGGFTAGGAGILLAYKVAKKHFIKNGNNRIILCTDGDFNVGVSSTSELERLVEEKRTENIYLSTIGVGMGNTKDSRMETLADKGNGKYSYIDSLLEANKVFNKELWGNLFTVAKDVKIQIEFNPAIVSEYRLIGYENRLLARTDFNDDTKDAGEMGSGHTVTALYEIVLNGADSSMPAQATTGTQAGKTPPPDDLVFQQPTVIPSEDLLVCKLRYKVPGDGNETSALISNRFASKDILIDFERCDNDFRFAMAVAEFGLLLRDSPYKAQANWAQVVTLGKMAKGADPEGDRAEFVKLAELAQLLTDKKK